MTVYTLNMEVGISLMNYCEIEVETSDREFFDYIDDVLNKAINEYMEQQ